jgi:hypothetical protein
MADDFVDVMIKEATDVNDVIRKLAEATRGVDLSLVAKALGEYQSACYAELYRREDQKYAVKTQANEAFSDSSS